MPGQGHNSGRMAEPGHAWRRHAWARARAALLPNLPIEVLRLRLARARELGLDYRTYAGIRAQTGHDVIGFLFSSNALQASARQPLVPSWAAAQLQSCAARRLGLAVAPLAPEALAQNSCLEACFAAPHVLAPPSAQAQQLRQALGRLPADRVVLIHAAPLEADWALYARLAGRLDAAAFFKVGPGGESARL